MKVVTMTAKAFWKGEYGITGTVEDQGQIYHVKLEIKGSYINSYSCSCTRGNSYKQMCPHEEALLSAYREQEKEGRGSVVSTSSQVRTMIREYTNREVAEIERTGEEMPVDFLPRVVLGLREVKVEFLVGRERKYLVKDLAAFAEAVEHGSYVEYGKTLAFYHSPDIFSVESTPMVQFVLEQVNVYRAFHVAASLRSLNLGPANRDRFFGLLAGKETEAENRNGVKYRMMVREANPELAIAVKKAGGDGIRVSVSRLYTSFMGERHLYIVDMETIYRCDEGCSRAMGVFFEQMTQGIGAPYEVLVNRKDIPLFYERVLRKLIPYGVLDVNGVDLESYRPVELKAKFMLDSRGQEEIVLKPELSYGEYRFHPVEDEKLPGTVCRDIPGEFRISQMLTRYFKHREPDTGDLVIRDDEDAMYRFLSKGMEELRELGEIYLSDAAAGLKLLPPTEISVGVRVDGDWLKLDIDTGSLNRGELLKILEGYRQKKPYHRLKSGEFLKLEDGGLMTVARMVDGLSVSRGDLQKGTMKIPRYRALYMDSLYKEYGRLNFYRDPEFKAMVRGMKSVEDSDFIVPQSLQTVLRGYQKTGFRWLRTLDAYGFGGILADDMGLGKTIQVISLLLDESGKADSLSLIVCPASLVYNWAYEFQAFAPLLKVKTVTGTGAEREAVIQEAEAYDVLITSYDLLKRDLKLYERLSFRFQIIDEAQYIKNPVTQSAKSVKLIRAKNRFALTGTPIENRLSELWSIFDYLMPGFLYSYQKFKKTYELPIVKEGDRESLKNLHQMIGPFILRRLKKDVLKDLPDKLETVVYSRMEEEQKKLYTAHAFRLKQELEGQSGREYGTGKIQVLAELTNLRQICCDPALHYENYRGGSSKIETCMELLNSGIEAGHKILLFSQFTSMLAVIGKRLQKEGIPYHTLIGATPKEERLRTVNSFQKDDVPVFLISLKAGGTGLNLTAADMVIHYDPWWNVAAQNQATDRTHRIGQEKQVSVFKLIMKDTIEENIVKLQDSKKNLAEQIITEGTISLSSLTKEELLEILGNE